MLQGILGEALLDSAALLREWVKLERRERNQVFRGSPLRLMARKGEHRRPRAGSVPGGARRRAARGEG